MTEFPRSPVRQLVAIVILLFGTMAGVALAFERVKKVLRVELTRQVEGTGPDAERYWALKALPTAADVADDMVTQKAGLQRDLQEAITAIREANGRGEWVLRPSAERDFSNAMAGKMPRYPDFTIVPPSKSAPDSGTFELDVVYQAPQPIQRKAIKISIIVRGSTAIAREPVLTDLANLESHGVSSLAGLTEEERRIPVFIGVNDAVSSRTVTWSTNTDHETAFEVAAFAFQTAKKYQLQDNQPRGPQASKSGVPSGAEEEVMSEIDGYVRQHFGLAGDWSVVPPADEEAKRVQSTYGPAPWTIRIALQAVEEVTFRIRGTRIEGTDEPLESYPNWTGDIAALEQSVRDDQSENFEALRGRLLNQKKFDELTKVILPKVEGEEKVVAAAVETGERSIVFTGLFQPSVTDLKAGIGYSTDKQLAGTFSLARQNLLVDNSLLKFSLTAGWEKQEGEFSYALPYFNSPDGRITSVLDLNASYLRDDDQKLGMPTGLDEEQWSGSVRNTFQFSKERVSEEARLAGQTNQEPPVGSAYLAKLMTSAGLSDTRLNAPTQLQSEVESGQVLFVLAELQQTWRHKLRLHGEKGLGEVELVGNGRVKKGFNLGPGDFDFLAADAVVTGTAYFGKTTSRDFLLRLVLGGATVSGNSPVFEEFRLGGDAIVRGMEEGERIARGVIYGTVQGGISLKRLWSIARSTRPADTSDSADASPAAAGPDFSKIYLNVFFDQAVITRRGSRDPGGSLSPRAFGASLKMDLPGAVPGELQFGYAWSPESIHEQGRVFTSVRLDF